MTRALGRTIRLRGVVVYLGVAGLLLVVATLLDGWAWDLTVRIDLGWSDWTKALRSFGYWPVWAGAAAAFLLVDSKRWARGGLRAMLRRAGYLALTITASGLLNEVVKLLVRRLRPSVTGGEYVYRAWSQDLLSTSNLSTPSGHATIAFGGAWAMCFLLPRAAPVWLAAAVGCAVTRVLQKTHFLSDVVASALLSFAVARVLWIWSRPPLLLGQGGRGPEAIQGRASPDDF